VTREVDVVVVGGGTAGAIVAARLAEDPELEVCLLEAGPSDEHDPALRDVRRWVELLRSPYDFDYAIAPQPRGNGAIRHSRARVLGGCSTHNSVIAFLPPEHDLRRWASDHGVRGWGLEDLAPAIAALRSRVPLELAPARNALVRDWVAAARDAGFPAADFAGGRFAPGVGWVALNARAARRTSSSVAYLHPLADLPANLTVATDAPVHRVQLGGDGRATGVEGPWGTVAARREVVLCCGVFETPKLLMLSGVGPGDELRRHGIPVRVELPGVGERLLDHPEGVVTWATSRPVPAEATQYLEATLIAARDPGERHELMCWCFSIPFEQATLREGGPPAGRSFSMAFDVAYARSEGVVRLRGPDPAAPPVIDPRYFTDPDGHDERVALDGLALARDLARRAPLAGWIERELSPGDRVRDRDALSEHVRRTAYTAFHPVGTCRMGAEGDPGAVVDARLRVRGLPNLRVADASVLPDLVGVNPCLTCMLVGERCAELLRDDLGRG
jgi:choline dehydrogenase